MANVEQTNGALDVSQAINKQIATKIKYLQELETAVDHHDDCKVYQLLDNQRYAAEIEHREQQPNEQGVMNLVDDLADQLSNFLSANLIQYLGILLLRGIPDWSLPHLFWELVGSAAVWRIRRAEYPLCL